MCHSVTALLSNVLASGHSFLRSRNWTVPNLAPNGNISVLGSWQFPLGYDVLAREASVGSTTQYT